MAKPKTLEQLRAEKEHIAEAEIYMDKRKIRIHNCCLLSMVAYSISFSTQLPSMAVFSIFSGGLLCILDSP